MDFIATLTSVANWVILDLLSAIGTTLIEDLVVILNGLDIPTDLEELRLLIVVVPRVSIHGGI